MDVSNRWQIGALNLGEQILVLRKTLSNPSVDKVILGSTPRDCTLHMICDAIRTRTMPKILVRGNLAPISLKRHAF